MFDVDHERVLKTEYCIDNKAPTLCPLLLLSLRTRMTSWWLLLSVPVMTRTWRSVSLEQVSLSVSPGLGFSVIPRP